MKRTTSRNTRRTLALAAAGLALAGGLSACSIGQQASTTGAPLHTIERVLNGADCPDCQSQVQRNYPDGSVQRVTKWDDGSFTDEQWATDHTYTRTTTVGTDTTTYRATWSDQR